MKAQDLITEYIDKYCNDIKHKGLSPDQAQEHALVREVISYYEKKGGAIDENS